MDTLGRFSVSFCSDLLAFGFMHTDAITTVNSVSLKTLKKQIRLLDAARTVTPRIKIKSNSEYIGEAALEMFPCPTVQNLTP